PARPRAAGRRPGPAARAIARAREHPAWLAYRWLRRQRPGGGVPRAARPAGLSPLPAAVPTSVVCRIGRPAWLGMTWFARSRCYAVRGAARGEPAIRRTQPARNWRGGRP